MTAEEARSGEKLEMILAAAQKRFRVYGLSKTTMQEIAGDIGMSKAALYYYYKDKESIFRAVVKQEQAHFMEAMQGLIRAGGKASDMLRSYVDMRITFLKEMLHIGKFGSGSYLEVKPLFGTLFTEFRKQELALVTEMLEYGRRKHEFRIRNVAQQAEFFLNTLRGIRQAVIYAQSTEAVPSLPPKMLRHLREQSLMFADLFIRDAVT